MIPDTPATRPSDWPKAFPSLPSPPPERGLSGIRDVDSLAIHPMRGALFETLMVSELMKTAFNQAKPND